MSDDPIEPIELAEGYVRAGEYEKADRALVAALGQVRKAKQENRKAASDLSGGHHE